MKIVLLTIGKTNQRYLNDGIREYANRLSHYTQFEIIEIPNLKKSKSLSKPEIVAKEGLLILDYIKYSDRLVLLDNNGRNLSSTMLASRLQSWMLLGKKRLIFVVGGAFGFSEAVYKRSDEELSLSKMTFPHQMVRLFFVEQIYRAYTILNNEPYHHNS